MFTPTHLEPYKRPQYYAGQTFPDYYTVYGVHRDSSALERSNMIVLCQRLGFSEPTRVPNWDESEPDSPVILTRASHFAVGWIDTLRIHKDAYSQLAVADELIGKLQDYPVIDEDHWSELEYSEACEYWAQMSVRERVEYLQRANLSVFGARKYWLPEDPQGRLQELLTGV